MIDFATKEMAQRAIVEGPQNEAVKALVSNENNDPYIKLAQSKSQRQQLIRMLKMCVVQC